MCIQFSKLFPGQLTWLVYLIGSVIGGRVSDTNSEEYDRMDGQLVCRYGTHHANHFKV